MPTSWPSPVLATLHAAADAVVAALAADVDWGPSGARTGQYASDLTADAAAVSVLAAGGLGVLSEESGRSGPARAEVVVALDPLDGSTNAHRRVPWYATSLCAVDGHGPLAAVVVDLPRGTRYEAVRGEGARRDGMALRASGCRSVAEAFVGLSGLPPASFGWSQFRALGAAALDLCAVAAGVLDGFVDCSPDAHGVWDYLAGVLVCQEAGAVVSDALGRDLVVLEHAARRTPVAGATPELHAALVEARRSF